MKTAITLFIFLVPIRCLAGGASEIQSDKIVLSVAVESPHYYVVEPGFKYNMMDLQAAIGIHQLLRVEANWRRRQEVWTAYQEAFADLPLTRPTEPEPGTRHACHLYTLLVDEKECGIDRDRFLSEMTERNIGVGVHYLSIPEHPYYQERFGWRPDHFPNAMRVGRTTVSLPLSAGLTESDVADVVSAVHQCILH